VAEHSNVETARAGIEAFNRRDLEAFAATLHDDIVWHAPGNNRYSGDFNGKAATLQRFKDQVEGGVTIEFVDVHDVVGGDDHVVGLLRVRVTGPGGEFTNPSVFVMHVRDGKLVEFWAMNDNQAEFDKAIEG
jgi:uncharacterized protein